MPLPLVTVVTPSYNMARFLPETMESVLSQDYPAIEYIVADGGSTDGTLELLARANGRARHFSARDSGPADAIHRGFLQARGEILAWLGADDLYLPGAVRTAVEYFAAHPETDVAYGQGWWIDESGRKLGPYPTMPFRSRRLERECFICQPAVFFRAAAYRRCELDAEVKVPFDYDLWIRMDKAGLRFDRLPQYLACSRMHRGGLTLGRREEMLRSSMDLLKRHYGYVPFPWVFGYTALERDGRDQFFEPLRPTPGVYLASLPAGFRWNPERRARFLAEWATAPILGAGRRLARLAGFRTRPTVTEILASNRG